MENRFIINLFLVCFALFLISSFVIGYDFISSDPVNLGHTANEVKIKINNAEYNLDSVMSGINNTRITCGWTGWDIPTCQTNCGIAGCEININRFRCSTGELEKEACCIKCAPFIVV